LTATAVMEDETEVDVTKLADWTSGTPTVATVGQNTGLVTSLEVGETIVTVSYEGLKGTSTITVTNNVKGIKVTPAQSTIIKGNTVQLTAIATMEDGTEEDVTKLADWTSGTPTVTTVGVNTGLVKGVGVGTSIITVNYGGQEGTAKVIVTNEMLEVRVTPNPAEVVKGGIAELTATAFFEDKTTQDVTRLANWVSGSSTLASVGATTGIVTGLQEGSTTVKATYNGKSGEATVNVIYGLVKNRYDTRLLYIR
jgi:Bacterial Ig-like domain (group 2).